VPLIAKRVHIRRPGCPPDVISALRGTFPGLPESYLSVAESLAIDGISIGYFNLTPSLSRDKSLPEQLRAFNDPTIRPMAEPFVQHGVYGVASLESDPVCVAHADGTFKVGQVVKYSDVMPGAPPVVLADSFEQLLLIAGNLQEIRGKREEPAQALREFREYLTPLVAGRQDGMESAWIEHIGVRLSILTLAGKRPEPFSWIAR
jgi:hypothetical protein